MIVPSATPALFVAVEPYGPAARRLLEGHYLGNPPPGCLFCVGVRAPEPGLFGAAPGALVGVCLVGRPVARRLAQDGTVGEVTRLWLAPGLPHGTASAVLRHAADVARRAGMVALISYHDRTRHTGCIYRKAGFRRDGVTRPRGKGWASRKRPASADVGATSKRRWRLDLGGSDDP